MNYYPFNSDKIIEFSYNIKMFSTFHTILNKPKGSENTSLGSPCLNSFLHEIAFNTDIDTEVRNEIDKKFRRSKTNGTYKFPRANSPQKQEKQLSMKRTPSTHRQVPERSQVKKTKSSELDKFRSVARSSSHLKTHVLKQGSYKTIKKTKIQNTSRHKSPFQALPKPATKRVRQIILRHTPSLNQNKFVAYKKKKKGQTFSLLSKL